jgi:hypothetical protein
LPTGIDGHWTVSAPSMSRPILDPFKASVLFRPQLLSTIKNPLQSFWSVIRSE